MIHLVRARPEADKNLCVVHKEVLMRNFSKARKIKKRKKSEQKVNLILVFSEELIEEIAQNVSMNVQESIERFFRRKMGRSDDNEKSNEA